MAITEAEGLNVVFEILVLAAVAKNRCPTNDAIRAEFFARGLTRWGGKCTAMPGNATVKLAEEGRIKVEIYGRNWRVVEIREGEHCGQRTKEDPRHSVPYKIFCKKL